MKVVILCGGKGTRLREETEYRPKPMMPIGERPILWHIMKIYAAHGYKDFVLCLGYKGWVMSDWGAVHSTDKAALSGLDQESGEELDRQVFFGAPLAEAIKTAFVPSEFNSP